MPMAGGAPSYCAGSSGCCDFSRRAAFYAPLRGFFSCRRRGITEGLKGGSRGWNAATVAGRIEPRIIPPKVKPMTRTSIHLALLAAGFLGLNSSTIQAQNKIAPPSIATVAPADADQILLDLIIGPNGGLVEKTFTKGQYKHVRSAFAPTLRGEIWRLTEAKPRQRRGCRFPVSQ